MADLNLPKYLSAEAQKHFDRYQKELNLAPVKLDLLAMYCHYVDVFERSAEVDDVEVEDKNGQTLRTSPKARYNLQVAREIQNLAKLLGIHQEVKHDENYTVNLD